MKLKDVQVASIKTRDETSAEWARYVAIAVIKSIDAKEDKIGARMPPGEAIDMVERILLTYHIEPKQPCYGCACGVPLANGMHQEATDIPNTVYTYPCTDLRIREMPKGVCHGPANVRAYVRRQGRRL